MRLTEWRIDLQRYEYKRDEKGDCFFSEGQLVQKLGQLEDILEKYAIVDLEQLDQRLEDIVRQFTQMEYGKRTWDDYYKLEQNLGIDLITLFKALKEGVVYKSDYGWEKGDYHWIFLKDKYVSIGMSYYEPFIILKLDDSTGVDWLYLDGYGKTWKIDGEELDDD